MTNCKHWYINEIGYECCDIYELCDEDRVECPPIENDRNERFTR